MPNEKRTPLPFAATIPAAQYLRVSRGARDCPIDLQELVIRKYAERFGFSVVSTYSDLGRSGLRLTNRPGFRTLLRDVIGRQTAYRAILVYDISRWGRFQNTDEAAHYEFLCVSAGIQVHYCNEQFANDGSPASLVQKTLKRLMAADYSRKLSARCFQGQKRIAESGFRVGASPGYGLRRLIVGEDGVPKNSVSTGQYKTLSTDRVVLVPGPDAEVRLIREIYDMALQHKHPTEIARILNSQRVPRQNGRPWTPRIVKTILTHPKYAGVNIWNQRAMKLGSSSVFNPHELWVTTKQNFPPLISPDQFARIQRMIRNRNAKPTDAALLDRLKKFLSRHGHLTGDLMCGKSKLNVPQTYVRRFGSLSRVYELLGYCPRDRFKKVDCLKRTEFLLDEIVAQLIGLFGPMLIVHRGTRDHRLEIRVGAGPRIAVFVCRKARDRSGKIRWRLYTGQRDQKRNLDLICLLDGKNESFARYYLTRPVSPKPSKQFLSANSAILRSGCRVTNLSHLKVVTDLMYPRG